MEILRQKHLYKSYFLPSGSSILYSSESFPPGGGTAEMAMEAAHALNNLREISGNYYQPVNVLELGTGPGTFLVELLSQMYVRKEVNLFGIDKDSHSLKLARINLARAAREAHLDLNTHIKKADWNKAETWEKFKPEFFHLIYFNPPYFSPDATIPAKLERTPPEMVMTYDRDGLFHYRRVLPELPRILSRQKGSTIIFRMPEDKNYEHLSNHNPGTLGRVVDIVRERMGITLNANYHWSDSGSVEKHFCEISIPF